MAKTRTASPDPAPSAPVAVAPAPAPSPVPNPTAVPARLAPTPKPGPTGDPLEDLPDEPTEAQVLEAMAAAGMTGNRETPPADGEAPPADDGAEAPPPAAAPVAPVAAADGAETEKDADGNAFPEWIEEKYRTGRTVAQAMEAQAKGYSEARKALRTHAADLRVKPGEAPKPDAAPEPWKELDQTTMRVIGEEFLAKGDLSPETYKRIQETFKIPPAQARVLVEQGIERQGAENLRIIEDAGFADLGAFQAVVQWASAAVPKADLEAINALLDGPQATRITRAAGVRMLRDLHAKANPPAPKRRAAGASGGEVVEKPIASYPEFVRELEALQDKFGNSPQQLEREVAKLQARAAAGRVQV